MSKKGKILGILLVVLFVSMSFATTVKVSALGISYDISQSRQRSNLGLAIYGAQGAGLKMTVSVSLDNSTYKLLKNKQLGISFKDGNGRVVDIAPKKVTSKTVKFTVSNLNLYGKNCYIAVSGWKKYNKRTKLMEGNLWRYKNRIWSPLF